MTPQQPTSKDLAERLARRSHGYLVDADGFSGHTGDVNPFKYGLPRVMVLEFEPQMGHSVWKDFWHHKRTMAGLLKCLRGEIKSGRFVAYRLITVHKEIYGVEP